MPASPPKDSEVQQARDALRARVRRLLHLDRERPGQDSLRTHIIPFIRGLGEAALIGGAIRDLARGGRSAFDSDFDFVVYGGDRERFAARLNERGGAIPNKFGGYRVSGFQMRVDVWHIDDTWAKTSARKYVTRPEDLLGCVFFDWDAILFDLERGRLIMDEAYLHRIKSGVMDIRLERNPNPDGAVIRAIRRAALWRVGFGINLSNFVRTHLESNSWSALVALDSRAFPNAVLRHLDRDKLMLALNTVGHGDSGPGTRPVPDWSLQGSLPLTSEPTFLAADSAVG